MPPSYEDKVRQFVSQISPSIRAILRSNVAVILREANFSGFRFIAINDKFDPIYRDKFDKMR